MSHIAKYFYPDKGGIENVVQTIVDGTNVLRVENEVIAFSKKSLKDLYDKQTIVRRCPYRIKILSMPLSLGYIKAIKSIKADVAILHAPNPLACFAVRFLDKSVPLIILHHADIINKGFAKKVVNREIAYAYNRASMVIATSGKYSDNSPELKPYSEKTRIIPLGIKDQTHSYLPVTTKKDRKLIVALGRMVSYKGFKYLIEAMKQLDGYKLILIGGGELLDELKEQASTLKNIEFKGSVPDHIKNEILSNAGIFCLPSTNRAEAFGVAILEALCFSTPVITTEIGSGNTFVNQHSETGFNISPRSPDQIVEAVRAIESLDDSSYEEMTRKCRQRYLKCFTAEVMSNEHLSAYQNVFKSNE